MTWAGVSGEDEAGDKPSKILAIRGLRPKAMTAHAGTHTEHTLPMDG
jgi:hypothetical protein